MAKKGSLLFCFISLIFCAHGAPHSKSKTSLDQKQTGDYNIRLNLKDFQIIALLGDDSFGNIGSYDYNYDYSELTIKPSTSTSTEKLEISFAPTSTAINLSSSTAIEQTSSEEASTKTPNTVANQSTSSEYTILAETSKPTTEKFITTRKIDPLLLESPDKIPVFVQVTKKDGNRRNVHSSNVSIVTPGNEQNNGQTVPNGDIYQIKKCRNGYSKDKNGRCRRYRRPQFPFELARIASSLAARLNPSSLEDSSESDSFEE